MLICRRGRLKLHILQFAPAIVVALALGETATAQFELSSDTARDVTADGFAFLDVRTQRSTYYAGELIPIELRFGFESELFAKNLVALFRPQMDVPVQLQAAWIAELAGARMLEEEPDAAQGLRSFVLNDELAGARELDENGSRIDNRGFRVFALERTFVATSAGQLELPPATLRFAFAKGFDDSLFAPAANAERVEAFVRSQSRMLSILPLPEEGRPEGFSGAVGQLTIQAEAAPREIELDATLQLTLRVRGVGNLESFDAPRFDRIEGWRINGSLDHKSRRERTIVVDLSAHSERTAQIPPIAFSYFDPAAPAGYRVASTDPIAVRVRQRIGAPSPAPSDVAQERGNEFVWFAAAGVLALSLGIALAVRRRRARSLPHD